LKLNDPAPAGNIYIITMHISDGILSPGICVAAHVVSVGWIYLSGRNISLEDIPRMGMTGAALFVASLIHFPVAGTSVHLSLFGIAGIMLGKRAFPAIYTALLLQALIFQHGGLLVLGVNALNMGAGALLAWLIWEIGKLPESFRALMAGFTGVIVPVAMMAVAFHISGYGRGIFYLFSAYLILAIIEALLSLSSVKLLSRITIQHESAMKK
jgi:cobalt/nickel transport system permease protein